MSDGEEVAAEEAVPTEEPAPEALQEAPAKSDNRLAAWAKRRSIQQIRRDSAAENARAFPWDERQNNETRLPGGETVHLAGLVLVEAFPPSMVGLLAKRLKAWPKSQSSRDRDLLSDLTRSRSGVSGGWTSLGIVRRPGAFIITDGGHDPELPEGVDAVLLRLSYATPSLSVVSATFILADEVGDLSPLLRADYTSQASPAVVQVQGRGAWLRQRTPWSRPKNYRYFTPIHLNNVVKADVCESRIKSIQDECHEWLAKNFPGRYAKYGVQRRPAARVLLTKDLVPFERSAEARLRVILGWTLEVWRSVDPRGWSLSIAWSGKRDQNVMTFAARRTEVRAEHTPPGEEQSNWSIMHRFADSHVDFIVRYSLVPLLAIYSGRLSGLRDRAGTKRLFRRPVKEARDLDGFVIGDGLDTVAITNDIKSMTSDVSQFRRHLAEYEEDLDSYPAGAKGERAPTEFVPALCAWLGELAKRLVEDTESATVNIRASADLRQAIANTRLQRVTSLLSVIAIVVAIIGVIIALHGN